MSHGWGGFGLSETRRGTKRSLLYRFVSGLLRCILAANIVLVILIIVLRFVPVPFSSFMAQKSIAGFIDHGFKHVLRYQWVPIGRMSSACGKAVITSEDQKFADHAGFDMDAIQNAFARNNRRGNLSVGGSTISQQVAKNLFLWPGRSYIRKGLEAYCTFLLEVIWSKKRILEVYLNIVELGDGIYGVSAASRFYFHTDPKQISSSQAALLAAVLPNPIRYSINHPTSYIENRQQWIVRYMGSSEIASAYSEIMN